MALPGASTCRVCQTSSFSSFISLQRTFHLRALARDHRLVRLVNLMTKRALRQQMLAYRRALSAESCSSASRIVEQAFINSAEFAVARVVVLYAAINNEIDTSDLLQAAFSLNKEVIYPVVAGEELLFRRVTAPADLLPGTFGILEPAAYCVEYPPSAADLIVIPGIAFDLDGRRIGYGKGYYDRALHRLEGEGRLVGFCHDFQLLDEIAEDPHDVKLDMIITEKRVVRPRVGLN